MKTFRQFQEGAGDKFSKMSDAQFKDWQRANPGAADKAEKLRNAARSATPKPVGSGAQLPNVPKPQPQTGQARWNSGQRFTDPRAQAVYDYQTRQNATRVAPRTTASVAQNLVKKPGLATRVMRGIGTAARVAGAVGSALLGLGEPK